MINLEKQKEARKNLLQEVISKDTKNNSIILELATGVGKTFLALQLIKEDKSNYPWIFLSPEVAQINSLREDIEKLTPELLENKIIDIICYASIGKYINMYEHINIVFDEVHHLTELKEDVSKLYNIHRAIYLSAVIPTTIINRICSITPNPSLISKNLKQAIHEGLIPPYNVEVHTLSISRNKTIEKKYKKGVFKISPYEQLDYYQKMYNKYQEEKEFGSKYLNLLRNTKNFIGSLKTEYIKKIYNTILHDHKCIIFASSIEQIEKIDANRGVNYKKGKKTNQKIIQQFNDGQETKLISFGMLKEGVNLKDIEIGVITDLTSVAKGSLKLIQKIGRVSRGIEPKIIFISLNHPIEKKLLEKSLNVFDKSTTNINFVKT